MPHIHIYQPHSNFLHSRIELHVQCCQQRHLDMQAAFRLEMKRQSVTMAATKKIDAELIITLLTI